MTLIRHNQLLIKFIFCAAGSPFLPNYGELCAVRARELNRIRQLYRVAEVQQIIVIELVRVHETEWCSVVRVKESSPLLLIPLGETRDERAVVFVDSVQVREPIKGPHTGSSIINENIAYPRPSIQLLSGRLNLFVRCYSCSARRLGLQWRAARLMTSSAIALLSCRTK